jgi:hypothetical protein
MTKPLMTSPARPTDSKLFKGAVRGLAQARQDRQRLIGREQKRVAVGCRPWRAASLPIMPLAPPRCSTTQGWENARPSLSAQGRPMASVAPPGAQGRMSLTLRSGQDGFHAAPSALASNHDKTMPTLH